MFQYAAGLAVALKNRTSLRLDTTFLNDRFPRKEFTYRTFDLDIFDLKPQFTPLSNISTALPVPGLWLASDALLIGIKDKLGMQKLIKEGDSSLFDPAVLGAGDRTLLWGHWQSERYFSEIAEKAEELVKRSK